MARRTLLVIGFALLSCGLTAARQDDPIKAKLEKAKATYDAAIVALRTETVAWLDVMVHRSRS